MTEQLCVTCLGAICYLDGVVMDRSETYLKLSHHPTFEALKQAHDLGCRLCRHAWEELPEPYQSNLLANERAQRSQPKHYHWHSKNQQSCATKFELGLSTHPASGLRYIFINIRFVTRLSPPLASEYTASIEYRYSLVPVAPLSSPPGMYLLLSNIVLP